MAERSRASVCVVVTTPLIIRFFLHRHLAELARRYDVTLVVNRESDAYAGMPAVPVEVVHVGIARKVALARDAAALIALFRLFSRRRYDLVYSVTPKAGLLAMCAAALARVPCRLHTFQGEVWAHARGLKRWIFKTMDRLTAWAATDLLAVSRSEQAFLEAQGVASPGRITVLGAGSIAGVDLERFVPDDAARAAVRAELGIPDEHVLCLYVGRLTADKGVLDLARAYARMFEDYPGLALVFVGPDEEDMQQRIRTACRGRDERVRFVGYTDAPERYMAAADLLCLPSYREGFGMVVVEAAAVGIPSVGSRIYGVSDAIDDGDTGLLFTVGDVGDLEAKLRRLIADGRYRHALGVNARARVQRDFAQQAVIGRFMEYVDRLVPATPPAGMKRRPSL